MNKLWSGGRIALLLLLVAIVATGCMPRGQAVDTGWTSLALDGSKLYAIRSTGDAVALDLDAEGDLLWEYAAAESSAAPGCGIAQQPAAGTPSNPALGAVYGSPAVDAGMLLFGSSEAALTALNAETGERAWSFPVDSAVVGGVAAAEGVAYFGTVGGYVYAVDIETHAAVWPAPFATGDRVWSTPVLSGDLVYVASMDHLIYAIDRATGKSKWIADIGAAIQGDISLYEGVIYAGGVDRRLHAIDASSGRENWKTDAMDAWVWGAPLRFGDMVLFTTLNGQLHGHRANDGSAVWAPITLKGGIAAGPVKAGQDIVVGTEEGLVYVVDAGAGTAQVIYGLDQQQQRGGYLSAPSVRDGTVYLGSTFGFIIALDPAQRSPELWVYPSPKEE